MPLDTPKAFANFSPGLRDNPGSAIRRSTQTLKGLIPRMPNAFSVYVAFCICAPGLSLRSNPGLKLANAFGVLPCT